MKLLIVINGLGTGGAQRSQAEMLPYLAAAGVEPILAVFYRQREGVEASIVSEGYDVRHVAARTPWGRVRGLRRILRDERPDLVHTTILEASLAGRAAAAGTRVPVLTSLVNESYAPVRLSDPHLNRVKLELVRRVDGWTARHWTDHFHAISETVRRSAIESLAIDPDRITVVERGRDPERLGARTPERRAAVRRAMGLDDAAEVVLQVGRQEYQKGQGDLIDAFDRLAAGRPGLHLWIAGRKGAASEALDAARGRSRFADRIHFLGHREDVPDLMAAADVFAFPSLFEGQGCALIEAMGLGMPIVASDIPVFREALDHEQSGLLVPVGSPAGLAEAIARLLDDRELGGRLGRRSHALFQERYSVERSAQGMIDLYRRVAAGRAA